MRIVASTVHGIITAEILGDQKDAMIFSLGGAANAVFARLAIFGGSMNSCGVCMKWK